MIHKFLIKKLPNTVCLLILIVLFALTSFSQNISPQEAAVARKEEKQKNEKSTGPAAHQAVMQYFEAPVYGDRMLKAGMMELKPAFNQLPQSQIQYAKSNLTSSQRTTVSRSPKNPNAATTRTNQASNRGRQVNKQYQTLKLQSATQANLRNAGNNRSTGAYHEAPPSRQNQLSRNTPAYDRVPSTYDRVTPTQGQNQAYQTARQPFESGRSNTYNQVPTQSQRTPAGYDSPNKPLNSQGNTYNQVPGQQYQASGGTNQYQQLNKTPAYDRVTSTYDRVTPTQGQNQAYQTARQPFESGRSNTYNQVPTQSQRTPAGYDSPNKPLNSQGNTYNQVPGQQYQASGGTNQYQQLNKAPSTYDRVVPTQGQRTNAGYESANRPLNSQGNTYNQVPGRQYQSAGGTNQYQQLNKTPSTPVYSNAPKPASSGYGAPPKPPSSAVVSRPVAEHYKHPWDIPPSKGSSNVYQTPPRREANWRETAPTKTNGVPGKVQQRYGDVPLKPLPKPQVVQTPGYGTPPKAPNRASVSTGHYSVPPKPSSAQTRRTPPGTVRPNTSSNRNNSQGRPTANQQTNQRNKKPVRKNTSVSERNRKAAREAAAQKVAEKEKKKKAMKKLLLK